MVGGDTGIGESEIPLGRRGLTEETAWPASEQGSYVTRTTIMVDNGMSLFPNFVCKQPMLSTTARPRNRIPRRTL